MIEPQPITVHTSGEHWPVNTSTLEAAVINLEVATKDSSKDLTSFVFAHFSIEQAQELVYTLEDAIKSAKQSQGK